MLELPDALDAARVRFATIAIAVFDWGSEPTRSVPKYVTLTRR
jgi:hypothetical protein